ncbi:MAG: transposase [Caldisericota bacterium]|nr:transposase [Caldisericota bacterium]
MGLLAVLHTWTGQLHHHPHVHMLGVQPAKRASMLF